MDYRLSHFMMDVIKGLTVFLVCVTYVNGQTIKAIINQRPELVTLKNYMTQLSFLDELGKSGKRYTFFAPSNDAFAKIPSSIRNKYGPGRTLGVVARDELNNIMKYHAVYNINGVVYKMEELGDQVLSTNAHDAAPLFFKLLSERQYVNGARIVEADVVASNGLVHIIDHFLYEPAQSYNALTYVQTHTQETDARLGTRIFNNLLVSYHSHIVPGLQEGFHALEILNGLSPRVTLFVPNDYTMSRINIDIFKQNFQLLKQVVEAHIIKDDTYHEALLEMLTGQEIPALDGHVSPKRFGRDLFVSNFCASGVISRANVTVENGVVYMIDGIMGYVYNDLLDKMKEIEDLTSFATKASSSAPVAEELTFNQIGSQLPEDEMVTVFAPTDDAMRGGEELLFDGAHLEKGLRLHIIKGRLDVSDMSNTTVRQTLQNGYTATFTRYEQDDDIKIWVEVNYVRGMILTGDICTLNGMLHKVDHIIGTPTQSIYEYTSETPEFSDLFRSLSDTGVTQVLKDMTRTITMFLPTNEAFEVMREGDLGNRLLQRKYWPNLRNVLHRHIIETEVIITELKVGTHIFDTKFGDTITLEKTATSVIINYGIFRISVLPHDMRMKNGMVHHVDRVFYDEGNPNAGEWSSPASINTASTLLTLFIASVLVLGSRLL